MGARLASVASVVIIMALASRYMDGEKFGLLAILLAVMNFTLSLDAGFRFGMGNRLAALAASPTPSVLPGQTFWTVFHLECLIGIFGAIVCLSILPMFNWGEIFKIQSITLTAEAQQGIPVMFAMLMLNQPLTLAGAALFANQHIVLASVLGAIQSLLLALVFWAGLSLPTFSLTCITRLGVFLLSGAGMTLFVVVWKRWRWSLPNWRQQAALLKSMSGPSLDFFWLNMSSMATALLGPFLAGAVAGLATAGDFALIQRIFGLLVTLHLALLSPLSPSFTRHASENDWGWITKKFTLCVKRFWPAVFLGGGLVLAVIHPWILQLWTGRWISDYGLVAFLASAAMATGWANTHSVLLNSLGAVRRQALLSLVMLIPVVALPLLLGKFLGVYGIALATTICIMPSAILTTQWVHSALHNKTLAV